MLTMLAKLLKVLNSEAEPGQISLAACLAMIAGFTPFFSLHNLVVLLLVLILRANLSAFLLGLTTFKGVAFILDPLFHKTGWMVLTAPAMDGLWTKMYNNTFWRLAHFNNTVLMGSLVISIMLVVPLYVVGNLLIRKYREHVLKYVQGLKIMQMFKASSFYSIYEKIEFVRGGK